MHDVPLRPLRILSSLAQGPLFIVGGTVRDLLRGTGRIKDIDLAMPSGSEDLARRFADAAGGSFFFLDEERRITRVVAKDGGAVLQFDFANFEGPDLAADLGRRDFTVNAMALDLRSFLASGSLDGVADPFGGREDLDARLVRATAPAVLDDDPLRLLRAARFAATLGFSVETGTAAEIRKRAERVTAPSPERVRDELFLILAAPDAERHLLLLESLGLLRPLLPELDGLRDFAPGKHHRFDILTHSFRTAGHVDGVLDGFDAIAPAHADAVRRHLDEELEQLVPRAAALRFACLLHDNAKSATYSRDEAGDVHFFGHDAAGAERAKEICRRFRLSNAAAAVVERLIRHHMRPLNLAAPGGPTKRALYRYCRDLKDAVPESVILSLADARATAEAMPEGFLDTSRTAAAILEYYYGKFLKTEAKPFVTGQDLIALGMEPGPRFRGILEEIRERQAEGTLKDRAEALAYLRTIGSRG
jgi:tRNA nucleotidyltransferase/poly(A) polymerase